MSDLVYSGVWGENKYLRAYCTLLQNHKEKTTTARVQIGYFFDTYAAQFAAEIQTYREQVQRLADAQKVGDSAEVQRLENYKRTSKTNAPCVIPAGYYPTTHTGDSFCEPSGLVCVDIDRKENLHISPEQWGNLPRDIMCSPFGKYCAFIGESRSGWQYGGYFLLVPITGADDFKQRYAAIARHFERCGLMVDKQAANMNHCRALTIQDSASRGEFDPLPISNNDAQPYPVKYAPPSPKRARNFVQYTHNNAAEFERVQRCCEYLCTYGVVITDDFSEWTRCAFAFAAEFGAAGEELFLKIAELSPKFRESENAYKWRNAMNTNTGRVGIATFWYMVKRAGIDIKQF